MNDNTRAHLKSGPLGWVVGVQCALLGALMLVAPHQFSDATYAQVQPQLVELGTLFLIAGAELVAVTALGVRGPAQLGAHGLAGIAALGLALAFAMSGLSTGAIAYGIVGVVTIVAPLISTPSSRDNADRDLFLILVGVSAAVVGLDLLVGGAAPNATLIWNGVPLGLGGALLLVSLIEPRLRVAGCLAAAAGLFSVAYASLPSHAWSGVLLYGGYGAALLIAPWLRNLGQVEFPSLSTRLALALCAAATLPLVAAFTVGANRDESINVERELTLNRAAAETIARGIDATVTGTQQAVVQVAGSGLLDGTPEVQTALLHGLTMNPPVRTWATFDAQGHALARSDDRPLEDIGQSPLFATAQQSSGPIVDIGPPSATGGPLVQIAYAYAGTDGQLRGVLLLQSDQITQSLFATGAGEGARAYVLDPAGRVSAQTVAAGVSEPPADVGEAAIWRALAEGAPPSGGLEYRSGSAQWLAGFSRLPHFGGVVVERPEAIALGGVFQARDILFVILMAAAALAVATGIAAANWLASPLRVLATAVEGLGSGESSAAPLAKTQIAEVKLLTDKFALMRDRLAARTAERERTQAALRDSEHRARAVVETALDAVITMDASGRITGWNRQAEKTFGWSSDEAVGRRMSELIVPERLREGHERGLRRYLATGETTILDERIEITAVRRDGTEIPVELSVTAVTLPSGTLFTGFVRDVTDRKRAEQDIRELNAELEQRVIERTSELARTVRQLEQVGDQLREESAALEVASRHKSDFLASMSHELRTPLNAIIGFSEVLLDHAATVPDEQRGTFLEYIRSSGQHLLGLINDILDLAKVEAGRMELRPEPVAINGVIEECVSMMRVVADAKHVSLESTIEPGDGIAVVDQPRLKQIIYNLLSNAVKFTPAGGFVAIHAVLTEQELRVEVRDSGVGIPRDEQELIFDEFRQSSATAPGQGTGLGLALVRKLVYLHGGRIWVESALGEGSCFTFVLPQRLPARNIERTAANGPVDALAKGGRLSILVVEDQREAAELLMLHLLRGGYDAFRASSAEEALRLAREVRPFAITLDILLPDRDGWDVLSKLKADPATRDIPVVVVSVVDNQELGFALGATDYLVKPFDRERLLDSLNHLREEPGRGKPTVLLVDGDQDDDNTYSRVLRSAGYEIVQAARGANALKAVRDQQPDLVVLDVASPDLGALELVGELRSSPETSHVPIVVCTDVQLSEQQHNLLRGQVRSIVPKSGGAPNDVLQELLSLERLNPGLAQIVGGPTGYAVAERFLAHIERELNRAARYGGRFSVVVIRAGDEQEARSERYLQQLCQGIAAELRQHDVVAHDDTGEIFVLLPNLEPERAPSLVSRFLTIVWSVRADHLSVVSHVKVGYASYPSDARSAQALLEAARNRGALYAEPG